MANDEHVALLKQGVNAWNKWRYENPGIRPDLIRADLYGANLSRANLNGANLDGANLFDANLIGAKLSRAYLSRANLNRVNLSGADLSEANLRRAYFNGADLSEAKLIGANLRRAVLLETNLTGADLTSCHVYGLSAWDLKLERTKQENLVITRADEPEITVDNIEVAQFVYLLLHNEKIRNVRGSADGALRARCGHWLRMIERTHRSHGPRDVQISPRTSVRQRAAGVPAIRRRR
jgi:Pentapeptide repeats (8 copies)